MTSMPGAWLVGQALSPVWGHGSTLVAAVLRCGAGDFACLELTLGTVFSILLPDEFEEPVQRSAQPFGFEHGDPPAEPLYRDGSDLRYLQPGWLGQSALW